MSSIVAPLISLPLRGGCQTNGSILVVCQKAEGADKATYVNLSPHIESALREAGKYDAIVYRADLPAIKDLIAGGTIQESDLTPPLSKTIIHKMAVGLGVRYVLTVSANSTKDGIVAQADTEAIIGQGTWSTLATEKILPAKPRGKPLGLLESVHVVVAGLMEKVDSAIARSPKQVGPKPGVPIVSDNPPGKGRGANDTQNRKQDANSSGQSAIKTTNPDVNAQRGTPNSTGPGNSVQPGPMAKPQNLPSTYELLVDKARRNGDMANLLVALRKAVTEKPKDIRLRRDLVKAYNDRGWHDMAREEASRAVALAPEDSSLHRVLGDALLNTGETELAVKEYLLAIQLSPKDAANLVALGDAYWNAGKPDDAQKTYEEAAKSDPKSAVPSRRLARLYGVRGKYTECLSAIMTAKALTPADDITSFREDHAALLTSVDSTLSEIISRLQASRKAFISGTKNREETHKEVSAQRKRAEDLAAFLDAIPDVGFNRVQALFTQAANLVSQTAEKTLDYLETQNTSQDEEASLLRIEAVKQLGDASKTLKLQLAAKKQ